MVNIQKLVIEYFVEELQNSYRQNYGGRDVHYGEIVGWIGRLALENIANSDILYHNVEHTIMVTSAGQSILQGKHLLEGGVSPKDWFHYMIAVLCHDIGYVRGILSTDNGRVIASGIDAETVEASPDGTDAVLTQYHVDRGMAFMRERFGKQIVKEMDVDLICSYIESTRFPVPKANQVIDMKGYAALVRAADFIGQLGDPGYLRKIPALFYEFQETGSNEKMGFESPGKMRQGFAGFFWEAIFPYIQEALRYLRVTQEGKQWIANLHSHVFAVEHYDTSPGN